MAIDIFRRKLKRWRNRARADLRRRLTRREPISAELLCDFGRKAPDGWVYHVGWDAWWPPEKYPEGLLA